MLGVARREEQSLAELYDRHGAAVFSICRRILHDASAAEDVTLDVFWEVWDKCERYDPSRGGVVTYLLLLARSRAIDQRRRSSAASKVGEIQGSLPESAAIDGALVVEEHERISAALARLDPAQRKAIELAYFDGLSQSEISELLGKPLGTVKTWIRQGLIRLRDLMRTNREDRDR